MLHSTLVLGIAAFRSGGSQECGEKTYAPEVTGAALGWDLSGLNPVNPVPHASSVPLGYDIINPWVVPAGDTAAPTTMNMTIMSLAGPAASGAATYFIWDGEDILVETDGNDSVWVN